MKDTTHSGKKITQTALLRFSRKKSCRENMIRQHFASQLWLSTKIYLAFKKFVHAKVTWQDVDHRLVKLVFFFYLSSRYSTLQMIWIGVNEINNLITHLTSERFNLDRSSYSLWIIRDKICSGLILSLSWNSFGNPKKQTSSSANQKLCTNWISFSIAELLFLTINVQVWISS